jgi:hypothetical protein
MSGDCIYNTRNKYYSDVCAIPWGMSITNDT